MPLPRIPDPAKPPIQVTATPCRHGPPLSRPIVGEVIGFALGWEGQARRKLWITGDPLLYDGLPQVADRLQVDTALLHLGCVRFPVTGPVRYSMTAREAVQLCRLSAPALPSPSPTKAGPTSTKGEMPSNSNSSRHQPTSPAVSVGCPSAPASASSGEHTSLRPGGPLSERLTSPLTVGAELRKRLSAQRWAATYPHGGGHVRCC